MCSVTLSWPLAPTGLGLIQDYVINSMDQLTEFDYLPLQSDDFSVRWVEKEPQDYIDYFLPTAEQFTDKHCTATVPESLCTICWELINVGEWIRPLNCSHFFHQECIDRWLRDKKQWEELRCPYCRQSQYGRKN